jgi:hypothetical protein
MEEELMPRVKESSAAAHAYAASHDLLRPLDRAILIVSHT